ncbi:MAG TPA: carboxypeptidase-like regulatory domain-containing protein, partial [Puia sp.]|nr:carboxypeptidase-like regulatory domain-containing protein [Puia sp.]
MILQRMARYSLALLLVIFYHPTLFAQVNQRVITGKVINSDTKEPMNNVSVTEKGSARGVTTDESGSFSLKVPGNGTVILSFSYIGFDPKDVKTKGDSAMLVSLVNSNKKLDDVVVVGYGTQKRSNILGAVATVDPKEVQDLPVANLSTALVNLVPGVSVNQSAGKPGASTTLSIRSPVSLNSQGTGPLYVIDGLAPIIGSGAGIDPTGKTAFDALDASEVESITFLKDGMATIYGARGANGVVLVTTKHGRPGKPRINYSGSYSNTRANKIPTMIDGYNQALLLNNWVENYAPWKVPTTEIYTPDELDTIKSRQFDWFKNEWIPNGSIQRHNVSVSGGSEKLTYFAGANYYNEIGNLPGVIANRYGMQLGMTAKIIPGLTSEVSVNYNTGYLNRPAVK